MPNHPHDPNHYVWCLTGSGEHLFCEEEDAQIYIRAENDNPHASGSVALCLESEKAYALGIWLIAAAARIESRYPEMAGKT